MRSWALWQQKINMLLIQIHRIQIANENKTYASYSEADANVTCSESETEGTTYRRKKKEKVISYVNADESTDDEDNTTIPMPPRISHSVMEEDSTSISSVEPGQTLQHACKCTKNASEIRALRVEINALSEMLRAFISRLDSASGESNGNKLGRSIMQEQEKSLNSLSIIEDELRLPCSTYEDFQNLNVKLEDVQVKAAVIRLLRRCTALTPEKTTTAMLQAVFLSNVAVECNWEGRGDKQRIKDFPVVKLMQCVSEATVNVTTTFGSVNLEYFLWRAIGDVNSNYCGTAPNLSKIRER
ncbi:hypothetical protein FQA39_LY09078 [Lamprigera yunnana]|nr:hypothetical protein FQA39_LY09078 [Lamprigera yunnana]